MKKIYISIPLVIAIVSFTGCKKYLETAPDQRSALTTPQKVAELLVTAYTQADYATFTESASDNAEDKGALAPGITTDPRNTNAYLWQDVKSIEEGSPTNFWNKSYAAIAAANAALDAINAAPDQTPYLASKGEALVARAYAHFMLVILFSKMYDPAGANDSPGIPYVTTPETVVFGQYSRGTVASTYASIERDLLAGMPLLKDITYTVPKYHFNVAAANAFAARFYLFKKDYAKVIAYASAVLPSTSPATVLRQWNGYYKTISADALLAVFTQASQPQNLLLTEAPSDWARWTGPDGLRYGFGLTLDVGLTTANVTGTYFTAIGVYYYGSVPNYTLLKFNELFVRTNANANIGTPYTIMPQFTTDELLMNRAEAYAMTGNSTAALADLNAFASVRITSYSATTHAITLAKIATFYNTTDVTKGLISTILDFKKTEFLQEGLRWFDLIRLNLPVVHLLKDNNNVYTSVTLPPDDPRRLFQLPSEVTLSGVPLNPR